MKKVVKVAVQEDKQVKSKHKKQPMDTDSVEGMDFKTSAVKKKRTNESDSNEAESPKKTKFSPSNKKGLKSGLKFQKGASFPSKSSNPTISGNC